MTSRRDRRGANAVEFALLMPVFYALLTTMVDYAWFYYHVEALDNAATAGCRAGALIDPGEGEANMAEVQRVTEAALIANLDAGGASCDEDQCRAEVEVWGDEPARSLRCTVTRSFVPPVGTFLGDRDLVSVMVVRMEWQRQ